MAEKQLFRVFNRFKIGDKCRAKIFLADDVKLKDIGLGGILLETTRRLNINNCYKIQIVLRNNEVLMPRGIVVRSFLKGTVKKEEETLPVYEVALRFIELNEKEKRLLDKLLSEIADSTIFTKEYINMLQAASISNAGSQI